MAGNLENFANGFLAPVPTQQTLSSNYLSSEDFDFINENLPELDSNEFERYGPRTVAGFLALTGAEVPFASDLIKWTEQGRLHTKYEGCSQVPASFLANARDEFTIASGTCTFRKGQTVLLDNGTTSKKAIVTAVGAETIDGGVDSFRVAYYTVEATSPFASATDVSVFVYGSEFAKGSSGMTGSLKANKDVYSVKPIIMKDNYQVSGSDMAQISWLETSTEDGRKGNFWFLKSSSETRLRFDDYLETSLVEGRPAADGSAAEAYADLVPDGTGSSETKAGTDGLFYSVEQRGNVWSGGNPTAISDFDTIIQRYDKQGAIEENMLFVNRQYAIDIDDMLAAQNGYGAGGTSFGAFNNDKDMALELGFVGFNRGGYEFYKTDWKYLNDPTMRGGLSAGAINGISVPAGTKTVYDQVLGMNATRPFLHVRYRASQHDNRRYKTWVTGSAGGAVTSDVDEMRINFLSERALCTYGANNFMLFEA